MGTFETYDPEGFFDELIDSNGQTRPGARLLVDKIESLPPGKPNLIGADESHAWFSLFSPDIGWVDLDPTNNMIPEECHITLAWGRDYADVTPVKGVVMGATAGTGCRPSRQPGSHKRLTSRSNPP